MLVDEDVDAERRLALGMVDHAPYLAHRLRIGARRAGDHRIAEPHFEQQRAEDVAVAVDHALDVAAEVSAPLKPLVANRSEEHTSELQSLMRISYAVFCLKQQKRYSI